MMNRFWLGSVWLLSCVALTGGQSPQPYRIMTPEAEVRCGPSPKFAITGKLRQGDSVYVRKIADGWAEILPPQGSIDWISYLVVRPQSTGASSKSLVIVPDEVPFRFGSSLSTVPLDVESRQVKLKRGAVVYAIGDKVKYDGTEWWPIQPPANDSRYIAESTLKASSTTTTVTTQTSGSSGGTTAQKEPLWERARQAEQDGRYDDAQRIYAQLSQRYSQTGMDFQFARMCDTRLEEIRLYRRTPGRLTSRESSSSPVTNLPTRNDPSRPPSPPLPGGGTNFTPPEMQRRSTGTQTSGPGRLRRSEVTIDGQRAYALESRTGDLLLYITPERGLNLDTYIGTRVELFGAIRERGDVRGASHMVANRVFYLGR